MEGLELKDLMTAVRVIASEKNLPEDVVLKIVEQGIAAAWRRAEGERDQDVRAEFNTNDGTAEVFVSKEVVELVGADAVEISLEDAKKIDPEAKIGDFVEEKYEVKSFGRVPAQTAKHVITQRLREAERDAVMEEFRDKIGDVIVGTISRIEPRVIRVDVGKAQGIIPQSEQIPGEYWSIGQRVKVYVKDIESGNRGPQLILSRGCADFIRFLFEQEVPELETGAVEIKGVAREAGRRTKIAVYSSMQGVDPVGTFVGGHGARVQAVMGEMSGANEKIDIITWSDNPVEYIKNAISPAEIVDIKVDEENKKAAVEVLEDQQSIAIGRFGQNVRLASQLTGYDLDIVVVEPPKEAPKKPVKNAEDSLFDAINNQED